MRGVIQGHHITYLIIKNPNRHWNCNKHCEAHRVPVAKPFDLTKYNLVSALEWSPNTIYCALTGICLFTMFLRSFYGSLNALTDGLILNRKVLFHISGQKDRVICAQLLLVMLRVVLLRAVELKTGQSAAGQILIAVCRDLARTLAATLVF